MASLGAVVVMTSRVVHCLIEAAKSEALVPGTDPDRRLADWRIVICGLNKIVPRSLGVPSAVERSENRHGRRQTRTVVHGWAGCRPAARGRAAARAVQRTVSAAFDSRGGCWSIPFWMKMKGRRGRRASVVCYSTRGTHFSGACCGAWRMALAWAAYRDPVHPLTALHPPHLSQ